MKIRLPIRKPAGPRHLPMKLKLKASVTRSRRTPVIEDEDEFLEEPEPNMKLSHAFVVVLVLHVIAVAGVFAFNSIKAHQSDKVFAAAAETATAKAQTTDPAVPPPGATDPSNGGGGPSIQPETPPPSTATTSAATPTPAPAPATATAGGKTHEMQPGETLTKIAAQYGVTIAALQQANNIADPKKLRAGTVLTIPEGAAAAAPAVTRPTAPTAPTATPTAESVAAAANIKDSGQVYTLVKGDNPVRIAKKLHVPYADLMALNGNPDPRKLQIGQKFKIPATTNK